MKSKRRNFVSFEQIPAVNYLQSDFINFFHSLFPALIEYNPLTVQEVAATLEPSVEFVRAKFSSKENQKLIFLHPELSVFYTSNPR